jgi:hypothetical protein
LGFRQPQQFPLDNSECVSIRRLDDCSVGRGTPQNVGEEMQHLNAHRERQNHVEPGGQESFPGQPSLPSHRQDLWGVPGIRRRSRETSEARRRRCSWKHAMADDGGSRGQDRVE